MRRLCTRYDTYYARSRRSVIRTLVGVLYIVVILLILIHGEEHKDNACIVDGLGIAPEREWQDDIGSLAADLMLRQRLVFFSRN